MIGPNRLMLSLMSLVGGIFLLVRPHNALAQYRQQLSNVSINSDYRYRPYDTMILVLLFCFSVILSLASRFIVTY